MSACELKNKLTPLVCLWCPGKKRLTCPEVPLPNGAMQVLGRQRVQQFNSRLNQIEEPIILPETDDFDLRPTETAAIKGVLGIRR